MCFGCSKEPSHRDGSFEYPQHMFWLRNNKNNFSYTLLSGGLKMCLLWIITEGGGGVGGGGAENVSY